VPRRSLLLLPVLAGAGLLFWSRSTGAATAVQLSDASSPLDTISDFADQAVSDVIGWQIPSRGEPYAPIIAAVEDANGIPRNLLARLLYQESRFRPDIIDGTVRSATGAAGIAQFMPATAAQFNIDPLDPAAAIGAAGRYLAQLYAQLGSWSLALAAYNWGPGNVANKGLDAAPKETRDYVAQITSDVPVA
jgi:soluble lytic murein transglycosylase-like protein